MSRLGESTDREGRAPTAEQRIDPAAENKNFVPDAVGWYAIALIVPVAFMAIPSVRHRNAARARPTMPPGQPRLGRASAAFAGHLQLTEKERQ